MVLSSKEIIWLSEKQKQLDGYIQETKNVIANEEILKKKIIAFFVELGEYANEERSFKFWSNKASSELEIQLDEYIDGIHFIISIGNQIEFDFSTFNKIDLENDNLIELYLILINDLSLFITNKFDKKTYLKLLNTYLSIGLQQKYSKEQIIEAYKIKNKINFERQNNNY